MAARRLIIVLVLLFAVSIVAAAIAPERRQVGSPAETSTSTTEEEQPGALGAGDVITTGIEASASDPETVRATVGDQLELSVGSREPIQVEIEPLGLLASASEQAPARFNLLLREAGMLPLTNADGGEVVGRVLVAAPKQAGSAAEGGGATKPRSRRP